MKNFFNFFFIVSFIPLNSLSYAQRSTGVIESHLTESRGVIGNYLIVRFHGDLAKNMFTHLRFGLVNFSRTPQNYPHYVIGKNIFCTNKMTTFCEIHFNTRKNKLNEFPWLLQPIDFNPDTDLVDVRRIGQFAAGTTKLGEFTLQTALGKYLIKITGTSADELYYRIAKNATESRRTFNGESEETIEATYVKNNSWICYKKISFSVPNSNDNEIKNIQPYCRSIFDLKTGTFTVDLDDILINDATDRPHPIETIGIIWGTENNDEEHVE